MTLRVQQAKGRRERYAMPPPLPGTNVASSTPLQPSKKLSHGWQSDASPAVGMDQALRSSASGGPSAVEDNVMNKLAAFCIAALLAPTIVDAQSLAGASGERSGITAIPRHVFEDATLPGKEFRVLHTTYEPAGQNPKHYHPSHVVFYVLEGSGVWQEEGKEPVVLKTGESLHVRPGTVHAHRNASTAERLVFLEFVVVDKAQRSTVPMR